MRAKEIFRTLEEWADDPTKPLFEARHLDLVKRKSGWNGEEFAPPAPVKPPEPEKRTLNWDRYAIIGIAVIVLALEVWRYYE